MRHLLFNLQQVPDDEADQVRAILIENDIRFYETQAGRWRIGLAGIWLPNADQKLEAKQVLHDYQSQRFQSGADERQRIHELTLLQGFLEQFYKEPSKFAGALLGILAVMAISILPFL